MKTVLFSGIAATAAFFAASAANASDTKPAPGSKIEYRAGTGVADDHGEPDDEPAMRPDGSVYEWGDKGSVAFAAPDGSRYSYEGEWDGKYVDPQGRVFEGDWRGRVIRHDGTGQITHSAPAPHGDAGAPYPEPEYDDDRYDDDHYDVPRGYENYERCLKSNGVTGAAIGALLGGFVGNRVAGRGDRLGGTLVGAGVGGLLGVAVEKASDKCKRHHPGHGRPGVAYPHHGYGGGYGWHGGYYYYPQSTVTVITSAPVTTTTTTVTEEVYYERVASPRKRAIRKWKPKPKPRCVCR